MEVGGILVALPDVVEEELVLKDALLEHRLRRHHRGLKGDETTRELERLAIGSRADNARARRYNVPSLR